ncbi:MAG: ribbon-helix-helix domain-containing protein [Halodesulfurarchaeum sp.]
MADTKVDLPDRTVGEIDQLVEQGEFVNREQAIEELLDMGLSAFQTTEERETTFEPDMFSQSVSDQEDPAALDEQDNERSF